MVPREHLPLTLVAVALLGFIFLLFREINAIKAAVAQLSVTSAKQPETLVEKIEEEDEDTLEPIVNASVANSARQPKVGVSQKSSKDSATASRSTLNSSVEKISASTKDLSR